MCDIHLRLTAVCLGILSFSAAHASCGSTACSINTNWDEHSITRPGLSIDLRQSYSRADKLRSGSSTITANPTDPANAGVEVENLRTITRVTTLSADYTHDEHWGMMLSIPYVARDHRHSIGDPNPALVSTETFDAKSLGDIRVVGRYRMTPNENDRSSMGFKFGLKLNTGRRDFQLTDATGALAGLPNEANLQPGNGSTDLILGMFWSQARPGELSSWFAQATLQGSVRHDTTFRPGNQVNLDAGTRYAFGKDTSGLLQLNAQWNTFDSGSGAALTAAGAPSSGGRSLALTPGLIHALAAGTNLYGLVQLPLYQYVNGEQLTPSWSLTMGINHRF